MPRILPNLEPRRWGRPKSSAAEHPPCPACDGPVPRRDGETTSKWLTRTCCSEKCRGRWSSRERISEAQSKTVQLEAEHPPCPICNAPVKRRPKEHSEKFIERATCGKLECIAAWHKIRAKEKRSSMNPGGRSGPYQPALDAAEAYRETEPVDYGNGFAAHNLRFKAAPGSVRKPFMQSYGVSSSWAVRP